MVDVCYKVHSNSGKCLKDFLSQPYYVWSKKLWSGRTNVEIVREQRYKYVDDYSPDFLNF